MERRKLNENRLVSILLLLDFCSCPIRWLPNGLYQQRELDVVIRASYAKPAPTPIIPPWPFHRLIETADRHQFECEPRLRS